MIKLALSRMFYYMGDITSKCITHHDNVINDRLGFMYQWFMMKSFDFQEDPKKGPWLETQFKDDENDHT